MRKFMLASTVVLFIVGQAMAGNNQVWMELELGGDNNDATCAIPVYFTPGDTADKQYLLDDNGRLTWALRLHAKGQHVHPTLGLANIRGVANFVFDLELYHDSVDPANLVETATFMSTANELMTNCGIEQNWSNAAEAGDFLSNAAFTYVFNLNSSGPARAIDWWSADAQGHKAGGLRMDVRCYPTVADDGKLRGMGAGYSRWNKPQIPERGSGGLGRPWGDSEDYPGLGYPDDFPSVPDASRPSGFWRTEQWAKDTGDSVLGWLGYGPVCEGQIEGLQAGVTYILRVVPGGGVNVLRNEAMSYTETFAIAADEVEGDDIFFTVDDPTLPEIVGWSSVRDCGGALLAIPLDAAAAPNVATVETRNGGVQMILVDFDGDVSAWHTPGQINFTGGLSLVVPGGESLINAGQTLQILVQGSTDASCCTVNIANAVSLAEGEDPDCAIRVLEGDANGDGAVDLIDMALVKSKNGQPVSAIPNGKYDINCDGSIDLIDMALTKSKNGSSIDPCP